ncbi:UDP-N-acetylglucosamine-N-acetylmuramylpentapeptide N-acetylglucosamine transferase [Filomicrobium insigne]|uniref:UDP-N-acetylglucosamine--N-acetylmuramyl-(pentapeptide) pyrophosphoryl-undecaprenol N-acetylglucosamine transferase n=1 Tax=Filomicrobium insigne TaxID=418854 RepID=A0A1H0MK33_9HYPH|nr:undecaprenyldiphospho-muramoylpentapeptide beta-N-acetylglucosaminyltransferase [Filomicrobium insigne]SDO80808.1 UDP-N-acetylglucosamine-N-acetylmuramylpentapeptide N-acetylglucosamine transferase [Filomicrobium insigne]
MAQELRVLLAAGGTGGHLFPAYALAQELGRRNIVVDLVTDMRGDRYGTDFPARSIHQISSATLVSKAPTEIARTGWMLSKGIGSALKLLGEISPDVVVGFGGYPAFPPLVAAKLRGVRTMVHEQNAVLGRANRLLARRVDIVATSFERVKYIDERNADKVRLTGNPVRDQVLQAAERPYWALMAGDVIQVLIFGGSQGARYFSDVLPSALALLPQELRVRLSVVQQAREEDVDRVRAAYQESGIAAEVASFFGALPDLMARSHLVIARAGASTVAEVTVIGRPSILVPLPHAVDNDQLYNATRLVEAGASWCFEQDKLTPEIWAREIGTLIASPTHLVQAANAAKELGRPDAVARLADVVEELAAHRENLAHGA